MQRKAESGNRILFLLTSVYLVIILFIYLLYPGFGGYQVITAQKWNAYLLITGVYVLAMVVLRLELTAVGAEKAPTPRKVWRSFDLPQKLVLLYLCATALSAFCSDYRVVSLWGSKRCEGLAAITLYCMSFLLISAYLQPQKWMLWLFAAAISINCMLCLVQFAGYNPLNLYPEGMNYYGANKQYAGEFLGTSGNVDILSAVLSLSIPAFWTAIIRLKDKLRWLFLIPLALCLVVLFKAFVAGGILGVAGAIVLSIPVMLDGETTRKRALFSVICLLIVALACVYLFGDRMGGFLYEASELLHGRWNDNFGSGRLYIWRNVIQLVPQHPFLGGGPDTLGLRTDAAFERYDESLGILIHSAIDAAHNEYLNILVNQGIIALLLYLAALGVSAVKWIRTAAEDSVAAICGCAILGYCIQAFFGISSPISTPYLWLALAALNRNHNLAEPFHVEKEGHKK